MARLSWPDNCFSTKMVCLRDTKQQCIITVPGIILFGHSWWLPISIIPENCKVMPCPVSSLIEGSVTRWTSSVYWCLSLALSPTLLISVQSSTSSVHLLLGLPVLLEPDVAPTIISLSNVSPLDLIRVTNAEETWQNLYQKLVPNRMHSGAARLLFRVGHNSPPFPHFLPPHSPFFSYLSIAPHFSLGPTLYTQL